MCSRSVDSKPEYRHHWDALCFSSFLKIILFLGHSPEVRRGDASFEQVPDDPSLASVLSLGAWAWHFRTFDTRPLGGVLAKLCPGKGC